MLIASFGMVTSFHNLSLSLPHSAHLSDPFNSGVYVIRVGENLKRDDYVELVELF